MLGSPPALHSDSRLERVAVEERAVWEANPADPEAWRAMYEAEQQHRNQGGGYWVLADDVAAPAWAITGNVAVDGRVILLTDGVSRHIGTDDAGPAPPTSTTPPGGTPPPSCSARCAATKPTVAYERTTQPWS